MSIPNDSMRYSSKIERHLRNLGNNEVLIRASKANKLHEVQIYSAIFNYYLL